jgi:branched-chain amino acid transport system substrate-binding protein
MVMGSKGKTFRLGVIILGFTFIWGIPSHAIEKKPYKVGALFGLTGPASFVGDPQGKTVKMIEHWVNAAGGIDRHPLEVIVYDTAGDKEKTALAVRKLVENNGVIAVIGTSQYGISSSVLPVIGDHKVPFISCTALPELPRWTKVRSWLFQVKGFDQGVEAVFEHIWKKKLAKIAILTPTSEFGNRGRTTLIKLAPQYGLEIVVDGRYRLDSGNVKVHLSRLKEMGAQAIVNWSEGISQVEVCQAWKALRIKLPLYHGPEFGNKRMIRLAKGDAEGVFCPLHRLSLVEKLPVEDSQMPALIAYKYCFEKKFGIEATSSGGHAWDALWMVVEALRMVGPDRKKMRGYFEKRVRNWPGVTGVFNMSRKDHYGLTKEVFKMGVVHKGGWILAD